MSPLGVRPPGTHIAQTASPKASHLLLFLRVSALRRRRSATVSRNIIAYAKFANRYWHRQPIWCAPQEREIVRQHWAPQRQTTTRAKREHFAASTLDSEVPPGLSSRTPAPIRAVSEDSARLLAK